MFLLNRLHEISKIQETIAQFSPTLLTLSSHLTTHVKAFAQLLHMHRLPIAYVRLLSTMARSTTFADAITALF